MQIRIYQAIIENRYCEETVFDRTFASLWEAQRVVEDHMAPASIKWSAWRDLDTNQVTVWYVRASDIEPASSRRDWEDYHMRIFLRLLNLGPASPVGG